MDASLQEEACSLAQLLVSVNGDNNICAMQKVGQGALDPDSIFEMTEVMKVLLFCSSISYTIYSFLYHYTPANLLTLPLTR